MATLAALGTNLFAGTYYDGVFISTDSGAHWIATSLANRYVPSIEVNGINLYAATDDTVFLSTDDGTNWIAATNGLPENTYVYDFA